MSVFIFELKVKIEIKMQVFFDNKNIDSKLSLIYIHPYGLNSQIWENQIKSPALNQYRQIFIDLPYHSNSSIEFPSQNFITLSRDLLSLIERLNCGNFILLGNSFGGDVIIHTLNSFSSNCRGLIICNTPPFGLSPNFHEMYLQNDLVTKLMDVKLPIEMRRNALLQTLSYNQWNNDFEWALNSYEKTGLKLLDDIFKAFSNHENLNEIELIIGTHLPILFVLGLDEDYVNNNYILDLFNNNSKIEFALIENSKHYPQRHNPIQFQKEVLKFLESITN
ncbi:MAG: alpha/beta fold hydrolase [Bacteroidia bacterium]